MRGLVGIALIVVAASAVASAETATTQRAAAPAAPVAPDESPPICLAAGGSCPTVLLLETTWGIKPAVTGPTGNSSGFDLGLEAGLLVNVPTRNEGFGGSFGLRFVSEAEAIPFVVRGRYRRWLSTRSNVDVSAGVLLANVNRGGNGGTAQLSLERSGKIALVLNIDIYNSNRDASGTAFEVGIALKFCGLWSLPTAALSLLAAAAARGNG